MNEASDRILMTGNEALGEGAIRAGCDAFFGYPITPQNELTAYMARHMPERNRVFIQAESEIAAINMVFGTAVTGKRAMTSSSSPGISLMQEGLSYIAGTEVPVVVANIQRGGPGLGNIAPGQADYFQAVKGGGHGDYHQIVLAPNSVQEMHDLTLQAFDLADRYRIAAMILSDGRLGQMMEPVRLYAGPTPQPPPKPWALTGARGRPPNFIRSLYLSENELEAVNHRLQAKYEQIRASEVRFEEHEAEHAEILLVAYGSCARICKGVLGLARSQGLSVGLFRPITLWPFPFDALKARAAHVKAVLVIEMSCGQMLEDVRLAVQDAVPVHFEGRSGGNVPLESAILARIQTLMAASSPRNGAKQKKNGAPGRQGER